MPRDINECIEAERMAAEHTMRAQKRLVSLLNLAPDAIIATDSSRRIIVFNRSAERIFGYSAAEIMGCPLENLMPTRYASHHGKLVTAFGQDYAPVREMSGRSGIVGLRKDGTEFPAEASISILREETGPIFFTILRDVTEKKQIMQKLEQLAMHDGLTGLPNRTLFLDRLSRTRALAEREERLAALLFIDLDGFKRVNDTFGHSVGDDLLRTIAKRLQEAVRRSDTVARLGGDEFAVILEQIRNEVSVSAIAETIIDRVHEPVYLDGNEVIVSASIGITIFPLDAKSEKELMIDADRAMYRAKVSGKNRFEFTATAPAMIAAHHDRLA